MADGLRSRRRALLIVPPLYDFAAYDLFSKPLGLMRVGSWLERYGWETVMVNALDHRDPASRRRWGAPRRAADGTGKFFRQRRGFPAELRPEGPRFARYGISEESFEGHLWEVLAGGRTDAVFVTTGMTYWYPGVREAVETVRRLDPRVPVVCGGVYAALMPDHCRAVCGADYAVAGDWGALAGWAENRGLDLPGAGPEGEYRWYGAVPAEAGVLQLNRGCPNRCRYCASRILEPRFSSGGVETALGITEELAVCRGTRNFAFYDDALLVAPEEGLLPFLEGLERRWGRRTAEGGLFPQRGDLRFFLPNAVHMSRLSPELLGRMEAAGFQEYRMGFESASGDFHARMDGKVDGGSLDRCVEAFREAGVSLGKAAVYVLAGLPGQDPGEVEASVRFAAARGVKVRLAQYSPVPGTSLWEESCRLSRFPLAEEPLYHSNTFFPLESEAFSRAELERLKGLVRDLNRRMKHP